MFKKAVDDLSKDNDYPARSILIDMYTRVYEGRLYDHLQYPFCVEYDMQGNYIQLRDRRPSVQYNICKLVVDDSVSLTFGSDHFPEVLCEDKNIEKFSADLIKDTKLNIKMIEAASYGSVGSIVILMRVLKEKIYWDVKITQYLTPVYKLDEPDCLAKLIEKYKVSGKDLAASGYSVDPDDQMYWFQRVWDEESEIYYAPWLVSEKDHVPEKDTKRTYQHNFGFVPLIWIKNLCKPNSIDGACTFKSGIDINIEIDYQLSQGGRGLKYSSDPTTILKVDDSLSFNQNNSVGVAQSQIMMPDGSMAQMSGQAFPSASADRKVVRSANNALVVGKDDDVKLLEISGHAAEAILSYTRQLREFGIEAMHGNRANADKVNAAQSGKAHRELNQSLIWLSEKLRISYGDYGLIPMIKMAVLATQKYSIQLNGNTYNNLTITKEPTLKWPQWYAKAPDDLQKEANAIKTLTDNGVLSKESGTKHVADDYGIKNVEEEKALIAEDQEKIQEQQPQVKEQVNV